MDRSDATSAESRSWIRRSIGKGLAIGLLTTPGVQALFVPTSGEAAVQPLCHGKMATIVGTPGGDTLRGTPGPDVIDGLGGNDQIWATAGTTPSAEVAAMT
jgi:Ca2+-binding RTX toxin-like protein